MTNQRKTDENQTKNPFSSERYFSVQREWYYYARGMNDEPFAYGPFPDKDTAIFDCEERFIKL